MGDGAKLYAATKQMGNDLTTVTKPQPLQFREDVRWYAAYTRANHEKSVAAQLTVRSVEHFVPSYVSVRRWKDRRVALDMPLFPGYVFVRMALGERLKVQTVPGVARLVGFDGAPEALPDREIEALQTGLAKFRGLPHPYLSVGRRVRVKCGPLVGMEGVLVRRKGEMRLVISIELIQRSVAVDVNVEDVEAVPLFAANSQAKIANGFERSLNSNSFFQTGAM